MNCSDELRLQKLVDDRHEMERLHSLAFGMLQKANQREEELVPRMKVDTEDLQAVLHCCLTLLSEKLESAL